MTRRLALYFAPEDGTELARFGRGWLSTAEHGDLVAEPRHYGFHATLKAPFRLAEGMEGAALRAAAAAFAGQRRPFVEPPLVLQPLHGFLALRPSRPSPAIDRLAADCVREFDRFRAPSSDDERRKRLAAPLSDRQKALFDQWGYPYVFDEYRFHMTLTRRLQDDETGVREVLAELAAAALEEPVEFRSLCLFEQPETGAPFELTARFPFAG